MEVDKGNMDMDMQVVSVAKIRQVSVDYVLLVFLFDQTANSLLVVYSVNSLLVLSVNSLLVVYSVNSLLVLSVNSLLVLLVAMVAMAS